MEVFRFVLKRSVREQLCLLPVEDDFYQQSVFPCCVCSPAIVVEPRHAEFSVVQDLWKDVSISLLRVLEVFLRPILSRQTNRWNHRKVSGVYGNIFHFGNENQGFVVFLQERSVFLIFGDNVNVSQQMIAEWTVFFQQCQ